MIEVVLLGRPVPWARAKRGRGGKAYTPARQAAHRKALAWEFKLAAKKHKKLAGPLTLNIEFDFAREMTTILLHESTMNLRTKRPDLDNCVKQILEALQDSGIIEDDARIGAISATKVG